MKFNNYAEKIAKCFICSIFSGSRTTQYGEYQHADFFFFFYWKTNFWTPLELQTSHYKL